MIPRLHESEHDCAARLTRNFVASWRSNQGAFAGTTRGKCSRGQWTDCRDQNFDALTNRLKPREKKRRFRVEKAIYGKIKRLCWQSFRCVFTKKCAEFVVGDEGFSRLLAKFFGELLDNSFADCWGSFGKLSGPRAFEPRKLH